MSGAASSIMAQNWPWCSQIVKKIYNHNVLVCLSMCAIYMDSRYHRMNGGVIGRENIAVVFTEVTFKNNSNIETILWSY